MLSVDAALFIRLPRHCCSVCTLTDLSVGCMAQPLFVIHRIAALTRNYHIYCIAGIASNFAGSSVVVASFVTTTVIAVERYLALRLRLRYREFVTLKRVITVLFASWLMSVSWSALWFWDRRVQDILRIALSSICVLTTTSSYLIIYKHIRRSQFRVSQHVVVPRTGSFNMLRFRRSVATMCYIYCFLLGCYLPYTCIMILLHWYEHSRLTVALQVPSVLSFL